MGVAVGGAANVLEGFTVVVGRAVDDASAVWGFFAVVEACFDVPGVVAAFEPQAVDCLAGELGFVVNATWNLNAK